MLKFYILFIYKVKNQIYNYTIDMSKLQDRSYTRKLKIICSPRVAVHPCESDLVMGNASSLVVLVTS